MWASHNTECFHFIVVVIWVLATSESILMKLYASTMHHSLLYCFLLFISLTTQNGVLIKPMQCSCSILRQSVPLFWTYFNKWFKVEKKVSYIIGLLHIVTLLLKFAFLSMVAMVTNQNSRHVGFLLKPLGNVFLENSLSEFVRTFSLLYP